MRVLVTGGYGFIGKAVCSWLQEVGMKPSVYDPAFGNDVLHRGQLNWRVRESDAVVHLAGVLGTKELFDSPEKAIDVNVHGTLNVLRACERHGVKYVGITVPDCWRNVYQATKLASRRLAEAWHDTYDVPVSHVRAWNAYGPGQRVFGVQKIVPTFSTKAWRGEPIPIWGNGMQTVDLVHVEDVAMMLVAALEYDDCQVFDAGTGKKQAVLEVADQIVKVTGKTVPIEYLPMRVGETPIDMAAGGEGWDLLGWKLEFDPERLEETVRWYEMIRP